MGAPANTARTIHTVNDVRSTHARIRLPILFISVWPNVKIMVFRGYAKIPWIFLLGFPAPLLFLDQDSRPLSGFVSIVSEKVLSE